MKKFLFSLLVVVIFSFPGMAQKSYAPTKKDKTLLWEISGNGLTQTSYLYGTIHLIGAKDFFLTEKTKEYFRKAGRLALEFNMEDMMDPAKIMPLIQGSFMKNDTTLQDLLTEEDYKLVKEHFEGMGMPIAFLEKIKPMFLSVMGSGDFNQMNLSDNKNVKSYEMEFIEMAKSQEKELDGLETAEYQLSIFDSIPYKAQAQMLLESITAGEQLEEGEDDQFTELVKLYKARDLYGLQVMLSSESAGINDFEDLLLINRNKNWIPVMEDLMSREVVFFAVGAGHLPGEEGVIALLRKEGYKVKPVMEKKKKKKK